MSPPSNDTHVIGIDLGATNMLLSVVSLDGGVIARAHETTDADRGFEHIVDKMIRGIGRVTAEAGVNENDIAAIGVAVAGAVDIASGVVLKAQNIGWVDRPLRAILEERVGRPVWIDNDVNAAVWGEYTFGAARGRGDCFGVWVGTGIGGGLVLNGRLYYGAFSTAGEFGMSVSQPDGPLGSRTVEDHASRTGMRRHIARELADHPDSAVHRLCGGVPERIGTRVLARAYEQGDPLACRIIDRGAYLLGIAIANFVTMLSVETVVVGGGITEALGERWLDLVRAQFAVDVFPDVCRNCRIVMTALRSDAGILGAAQLAQMAIQST
jgi:glucokinase